jgi:hypothetical protein
MLGQRYALSLVQWRSASELELGDHTADRRHELGEGRRGVGFELRTFGREFGYSRTRH